MHIYEGTILYIDMKRLGLAGILSVMFYTCIVTGKKWTSLITKHAELVVEHCSTGNNSVPCALLYTQESLRLLTYQMERKMAFHSVQTPAALSVRFDSFSVMIHALHFVVL